MQTIILKYEGMLFLKIMENYWTILHLKLYDQTMHIIFHSNMLVTFLNMHVDWAYAQSINLIHTIKVKPLREC